MATWEVLEESRNDYGHGFGMRNEVEEAYMAGCRHGYEKAMREVRGGMGFRESGNNNYSNGNYSSIGERRIPNYYPEYPVMDEMGERRRRRANGEFY